MMNRTIPPLSSDQIERFWSYVNKTESCWLWSRAPNAGGYGRFYVAHGVYFQAHRIAYLIANGSISEHLVLDHLCRNRLCVNPAHLEQVTSAVNVLRGVGVGAMCARATHCKNGHPFDVIWQGNRRYCKLCHNNRTKAWRERAMA